MVGKTVRMIDASVAVSTVSVSTARSVPKSATAIGLAVATKGAVPRQLGLSRSVLEANGFEGKAGQILVVPTGGATVIAVGVGDPGAIDANGLRTAAAAFARAASKHADVATNLADLDEVDARAAGQAVAEGVLLASYRYVGLKNDPKVAARLAVTHAGHERQAPQGRRSREPSVARSSPAPLRSHGNSRTRRRPTSTPRTSQPEQSTSVRRPACTWRCSTRINSSRWAAADCSASTGARPSRRGWSS